MGMRRLSTVCKGFVPAQPNEGQNTLSLSGFEVLPKHWARAYSCTAGSHSAPLHFEDRLVNTEEGEGS